MAGRVSCSVVHHTLGSLEQFARQAVTAAASPALNGSSSMWASTSTAASTRRPLLASRLLQNTSTPSLPRSPAASSPAAVSTTTSSQDDASHLGRMLFKPDTRPAGQAKLPRRIARLYPRRPLLRQLESLRLSSSTSPTRPFFTSSFRGYSTNANSEGPSSSSTTAEADNKAGLMGKLKELTRKYGWATVVVYLIFSAVDFGVCFFLINLVGAEHVRKGQDYVLDALVYGTPKRKDVLLQAGEQNGNGILGFLKSWREKHKLEDVENAANSSKSSGSSSLWATAVLAYGIHKTLLLPVRLGLTAAATPAIVK